MAFYRQHIHRHLVPLLESPTSRVRAVFFQVIYSQSAQSTSPHESQISKGACTSNHMTCILSNAEGPREKLVSRTRLSLFRRESGHARLVKSQYAQLFSAHAYKTAALKVVSTFTYSFVLELKGYSDAYLFKACLRLIAGNLCLRS